MKETMTELSVTPRNLLEQAMKRFLITTAALAALITTAQAQQRQFYDAAGRNAGRAVTDSQGSTTFYDAAGRAAARSSTTGQTTTIYDAGGRVIERSERGKR